ncbi:MAG TPA: alpha/beta fold hydrolase [Thermoanaerobaculia bacterium]|nr:alpha/beta fold hydrolase [Thermoanaerobaculia bacterium]
MSRFLASLLAALLLLSLACATAPPAPAPAPAASSYLDRLPPLIDRTLFFDDPKIASAQVSPDGRFISFRKPYKDVMNIWVKKVDEPFDAARPITADTARPVPGYFWAEDGSYILYVQDKGGNENYHVYAVDPAGAADPATGVPPARDLTPLENVRAAIYAVPEGTPNEILVGLNDRDPALHDVYRVNIRTGERQLVMRNEQNVAAFVADLNGRIGLAFRQTPDGGSETLRVENGVLGRALYSCAFGETCQPVRFHKNGRQVYMISDKGDANLSRLLLMDVDSGATTLVESDPENQVDFAQPIFSDHTEELIGTVYVGDRVRIYARDDEFAKVLADLRAKLPDGELGFTSSTEDERLLTVSVSRDVNPGTVYLYDAAARTVQKLYDTRPDLPTEHLAPMQAIRYTARDGRSIPAYLTTPKNVEAKNLPVVLYVHGGPWARDMWGYNSIHQFLANRGYAVLSMNFRGSTGYGKEHLNAGNMEWGTGAMQHDITDGVRYLIEKGIADPKRVGIMGGSYGGYATLAGVTFTPDLYAAGVDIVGPSNISTLINSFPAYWGPLMKIWHLRVGDPKIAEDKARLDAQSPLFRASEIKAPLLVIQGANDPRVKQAESDSIVIALRDLGRDVGYIVAPDEGHGFQGRDNRIAMFAAIEKFLAKHLGGRYQESMEPKIQEKLTAITVDPKSVAAPKIATEADAAATAPLPAVDVTMIEPAKYAYQTHVSVGGREIDIKSTRVVRKATEAGEALWVIESEVATPMGKGTDVFTLRQASLLPVRREVKQGPATIGLVFGDQGVTGSIKAGPQEMPIDVKQTAPLYGDEAATDLVIAALPLSAGYRTSFRAFELGMQPRQRVWSLRVDGEESATVGAGTFDTWRVVLEPLDGEGGGETVWVTKAKPRFVVKSEGKMPAQAGGGTATTTLVSREAIK